MDVISLHLPGLRITRLGHSAPPESMADLYAQVEDLLEHLHARPAARDELDSDSQGLKRQLLVTVDGLSEELAPRDARRVTLAALTGGMFAGALDGALLFGLGERVAQPRLESAHPHLRKPTKVLWKNLDQVLQTGEESWKDGHIDDLQLLSGYGKHENRHSLDEGEQMEGKTRQDRPAFHGFLLASFKGAYAMGVVDAAVMFVGGERPGAPPAGSPS